MPEPKRPLPEVTPDNEFFWRSGKDGVLRLKRCPACAVLLHPSTIICPGCYAEKLETENVSGRATVAAFTINHHQWHPAFKPPYVLAIVEIEEQKDVRLTTRLVDCDPDEVDIGMPVEVRFEHVEDVWLPLFAPVRS